MVKVNITQDECKDISMEEIKKLYKDNQILYHQGEYYLKGHPHIHTCSYGSCMRLVWGHIGYCIYHTSGKYCLQCGRFHEPGTPCIKLKDCEYGTNTSLSFNIEKDSKSWKPRGEAVSNNQFINSIGQFQTECELILDDKEYLNDWYDISRNNLFNNYFKREDVNIKGSITLYNNKILSKIIGNKSVSNYSIRAGRKQNRYHNSYIKGISDDGLVNIDTIDLYGNIKHTKEKFNSIYKELGLDIENDTLYNKYNYIISSDMYHKVDALECNSRFGSCQQSHNADSYAKGAYDSITNGCNCPLLIYKDSDTKCFNPIGRITTRIMYDKQGQEYILIDRLYQDGSLSSSRAKGEVYKEIILDLKKQGYKVIVTNYSAHDSSTLQYVNSLGLESQGVVTDLCQPLRRLYNNCGYYSDGGIEVLQGTINGVEFATDYLDKAFIL